MTKNMKFAIGSDHAGFKLKEKVVQYLRSCEVDLKDYGAFSEERIDYPDVAIEVSKGVADGDFDSGILICGTGIGMSMAANKVAGVRAALCRDMDCAELSRLHNDANVLVLSGWKTSPEDACKIVEKWMNTPFSNEERHARRVGKIAEIERD
ncbi:MAG: ribose 5-phosphate isomerase B [Armatimonadota bacterium]|nr:ribose 5-phosphate isomerase B [Armatimonadota bacterium]